MNDARDKKDVPQFFRLNVEVGDLDKAIHFSRHCLASRAGSSRGRAATMNADRSRCKWSTFRQQADLIMQRKRFTSR
jgi:hypothetical protein